MLESYIANSTFVSTTNLGISENNVTVNNILTTTVFANSTVEMRFFEYCNSPFKTRDTISIGRSKLHRSGIFHNFQGGLTIESYLVVESNQLITVPLSPNPNSIESLPLKNVNHLYDSVVHFRGMNESLFMSPITTTRSVSGNFAQHDLQAYTLLSSLIPFRVPVRVQLTFTQTSVESLAHVFNTFVSTSQKRYQYIAKQIHQMQQSPVNSGAYVHDVQIEANPQMDEFSGGWDECHNTYKNQFDECILTASKKNEFTREKNGVCFGRQFFISLERAARSCGYETLLIDNPYTGTETAVWSTNNRVNGTLVVRPRNGIAASYEDSNIMLYVNESSIVSDEYKMIYDSNRFLTTPLVSIAYFASSHPFLIVPQINGSLSSNAVLKQLIFEAVTFLPQSDSSGNRVVFSTSLYDGTSPLKYNSIDAVKSIDLLRFQKCRIIPTFSPGALLSFYHGSHLIAIDTNGQTGYIQLLNTIQNFEFVDSYMQTMDTFFGSATTPNLLPMNISSAYVVRDSRFVNLRNGIFDLSSGSLPKTILLEYISILSSSPNTVSNSVIRILGTQFNANDVNVRIRTFNYTASNLLLPDTTATTRILHIENVSNLTLENPLTSQEMLGVGLYFSNIGNIPCNATSLLNLHLDFPLFKGVLYDWMCPLKSCKGDSCKEDPDLVQIECVVDKSYPSTGRQYLLTRFQSIQQAIFKCNMVNGHRYIDIVPAVYNETALIIRPKYPQETLHLRPYNGNQTHKIILLGSSHTKDLSSSSWTLDIDGFDFLNTLGLTSYSPTLSSYILYPSTDAYPLDSLRITNTRFIAYQPIVPLSSPLPDVQNYDAWVSIISTLITLNPLISPHIRSPNVNTVVLAAVKRVSYLKNVEFHGSKFYGLKENKNEADRPNSITYLEDVDGYNQWQTFVSLTNQWNVTRIRSKCVMCGGLSFQSGLPAAVVYISWGGGGNHYYESGVQVELGNVLSNTYVTQRLPYGNPYPGYIGYLATLWIQGAGGNNSTWKTFKIRGNRYVGYPIGVRVDDIPSFVLALNDDSIYLDDLQKEPRQIQAMNNVTHPLEAIHATKWDIKFGTPLLDDYVAPKQINVCHRMCPNTLSGSFCRVSASYLSLDSQHYNSIKTSIRKCPFCTIYIMDSIFYENVTTDFVHETARSCSILNIRFFALGILAGHHTFSQNCQSGDLVPSTVVWRNTIFQHDNGSGNQTLNSTITTEPTISLESITPSCALPSQFKIESSTFFHPSQTNGLRDAISCAGTCLFSNISLNAVSVTGVYRDVLHVSGAVSNVNVYVTGTNVVTPTKGSNVYMEDLQGFYISDNTFRCKNSTEISSSSKIGCLHVFGTSGLSSGLHTVKNNRILVDASAGEPYPSKFGLSAGRYPPPFDGIYWNLDGPYTLSQIDILLKNFTGNDGNALQYGIHVEAYGVETLIPCSPGTDDTINDIQRRNPINGALSPIAITDPTGIVQNNVYMQVDLLRCLVFDPFFGVSIQSIDTILVYVLIAGLLIITCVFGPCRGCEICCDTRKGEMEADPSIPDRTNDLSDYSKKDQ
jgi:hypothetical protein